MHNKAMFNGFLLLGRISEISVKGVWIET